MLRFIRHLSGNRAYLVFGVAVLLSLVMMALGPSKKLSLARSVAAALLRTGHQVFSWPMNLAGLRFENEILKEQNLRLSLELLKLREARLENARLRGLLRFRDRMGGTYLAAKVIARDPDRVPNTILIDVGSSDDVEERMPVVTAEGLVGRVLEAHPWTAVVQLLLDRNCRVSAVVQREERTPGIVLCEDGNIYLKHVPVRGVVEEGDVVVSSGLGGVFPKGLLVGRVAKVGEEQMGLFKEVVLAPGVTFGNLEEVFVLKQKSLRDRGPVSP